MHHQVDKVDVVDNHPFRTVLTVWPDGRHEWYERSKCAARRVLLVIEGQGGRLPGISSRTIEIVKAEAEGMLQTKH